MNATLTVGAHAFGVGVRVTEFVSDVAVVWLLIETARRGTIADSRDAPRRQVVALQ